MSRSNWIQLVVIAGVLALIFLLAMTPGCATIGGGGPAEKPETVLSVAAASVDREAGAVQTVAGQLLPDQADKAAILTTSAGRLRETAASIGGAVGDVVKQAETIIGLRADVQKARDDVGNRGNALMYTLIPILILACAAGVFVRGYLHLDAGLWITASAAVALVVDIMFLRYGNVLAIGGVVLLMAGMACAAIYAGIRLKRTILSVTDGIEAAKPDILNTGPGKAAVNALTSALAASQTEAKTQTLLDKLRGHAPRKVLPPKGI